MRHVSACEVYYAAYEPSNRQITRRFLAKCRKITKRRKQTSANSGKCRIPSSQLHEIPLVVPVMATTQTHTPFGVSLKCAKCPLRSCDHDNDAPPIIAGNGDEQLPGRSGPAQAVETSAHVVDVARLAWHHSAPHNHATPGQRWSGGGADGLRNESSKQQETKKQKTKKKQQRQRVPHAESKACETMSAVIP